MSATARLASFIADARWSDVPASVRHDAKRSLLNWLGCAIGGSRAPSVDLAIESLAVFSGPAQATVINRDRRFDVATTAIINGVASSVLDFDDTHLQTVIHPSVPVASATLALAEHLKVPGEAFMHAFVIGIEAACKVGNAISPEHYACGWHVTSTCGTIGAAAACARLLGLDQTQAAYAIGMAASQSAGLSEMLGSPTRMFNMGHAARNGFMAAWYASKGITSSACALEAPRGFGNAFTTRCDWSALTDTLGLTWELAANAFKPYPCGIVVHPVIDGCLLLRERHAIRAGDIDRVEVTVNPAVQIIMSRPDPADGMRSKVSAEHCIAVAMVQGAAGVQQFTDAVVRDPEVTALRRRARLLCSDTVAKDAAGVCVVMKDGTRHETFIAHARGSVEVPLTDRELEDKFRSLFAYGRSGSDAARVIGIVRDLETLRDAGALART
ncbi:MAG: MmgE/PrpD family protein [Rhodocyclaceae bacterium]|nr:MmgE/PrpD family protein [Rhodocyclaceae bacterium]MCE2979188.1 MmgE/PrpD family protein [Betaproteobacteria bacterium]MCA3076843.1 MmgE/PrpD family protein [Rhodocyclaceae bacterium]MCA3090013.1 MmgE/PrpD family protein [Rhodocyclaceae bacterium]MCA3099474.1 MmgE/PrpD family protein [Rhodocyclaceae bacterium]